MTDPTPPRPTYTPGWYPDATSPGNDRYHDGSMWTVQVRPTVPSDATTAPPAVTTAKKERNLLGIVALTTSVAGAIFACIPGALVVGWVLLPIGLVLGIVALLQKGRSKWQGLTAVIVSVVGTVVGVIVFLALATSAVSDAIDDAVTEDMSASVDSEEDAATEQSSSEEPAAPEAQDLILGETAFGVDAESGIGWYAVEVTNPNADYVFSFSGIDVEAYDPNGVLVDTDSSYGTILSGRSYYVGSFYDIGSAQIDHIEVRGPTADAATHSPAAETGSFELGALQTGSDYDYMTVNGTVTSSFSEDQDMVRIDVIARKDGAIVGIDQTYTDRVPAGGTAAWSVDYWKVPLDAAIEAYPHL